jgi:hypothetical protein
MIVRQRGAIIMIAPLQYRWAFLRPGEYPYRLHSTGINSPALSADIETNRGSAGDTQDPHTPTCLF